MNALEACLYSFVDPSQNVIELLLISWRQTASVVAQHFQSGGLAEHVEVELPFRDIGLLLGLGLEFVLEGMCQVLHHL